MTSTARPFPVNVHDPAAATVPGVLAFGVREYGEQVAFRSSTDDPVGEITYSGLDRMSAALAVELAPALQPGEFALLGGRNSIGWIAAFFAVARLGGVPVPVDPELDSESLAYIVTEIAPRVVLGDSAFLRRTEDTGEVRIDVASLRPADVMPGDLPQRSERQGDDLAVVLYSTGTTGTPKGIMLSHRNLTSNVQSAIDAVGLHEGDCLFLVLPGHHAFPLTTGILSPIVAGVPVVLEHRLSRVAARLAEARPTIVLGVPALWETVIRRVRHQARSGFKKYALKGGLALNRVLVQRFGFNAGRSLFRPLQRTLGGRLRLAVSGGAALPAEVARDAMLLGIPLLQGYGLSEASPVVAAQRFDDNRFWRSRYYWQTSGTVGTPVLGVSVRIEPVEDLEDMGELVVEGPNVMLGYYQRPEETAESLDGRALHTGDLARIDSDGNIWITGRRRLTHKTPGGEFVNLERVDRIIQGIPEVEQACVLVRQDPDWRLVAVVFPSDEATDGTEDAEGVRERVRAAIARESGELRVFERVRGVELTDTPLPVTRLGKVRRGSLPDQFSFDPERWREQLAAFREDG